MSSWWKCPILEGSKFGDDFSKSFVIHSFYQFYILSLRRTLIRELLMNSQFYYKQWVFVFCQKKKKRNSLSRPTRNNAIGPLQKIPYYSQIETCCFQVAYVCVLTCLAVFSCETRSAVTEVFLARISSEACSVVKTRVTGTEVLAKI